MIMGITWTHLKSVWNPSGSSDVPYSSKPITGQELFLAVSYSKPALATTTGEQNSAQTDGSIWNFHICVLFLISISIEEVF